MSRINYITESALLGDSISEIARKNKISRVTVRKYLNKTDWNTNELKVQRGSKLDPYKAMIDEWLFTDLSEPRKQRHTAKRVYERLCDECFYVGGIRTVEKYVRMKKEEFKLKVESSTILELCRPVEEAQVDFGSFEYIDANEARVKGHHLCVSFPSSNACYWQAFHGENQECLLEGLQRIFEYLGGVPKRMVFDNMSSAVVSINKDGSRTLTNQFLRFKLHHGFQAVFCNPASGNEKGNVECNVGYQRRNMLVPVPKINNFTEFNQSLFIRCERAMKRVHYKRKEPIIDLLDENLEGLKELPLTKFKVGRYFDVKTNGYSFFTFEGNQYSTKPTMRNLSMMIHVTSEKITVLDKEHKVVDIHDRMYGKQAEAIVNWIYYINAIAKKPKGIRYTKFYQHLTYEWLEYFEQLSELQCSEFLLCYGEHLLDERYDVLTKTLRIVKEMKNNTLDAFTLQYRRLQDPMTQAIDLTYNQEIPDIQPYSTNLSKYDTFMGRQ